MNSSEINDAGEVQVEEWALPPKAPGFYSCRFMQFDRVLIQSFHP